MGGQGRIISEEYRLWGKENGIYCMYLSEHGLPPLVLWCSGYSSFAKRVDMQVLS